MAAIGQVLRGPGLTMKIVALDSEELVLDVGYDREARMPPQHYHPTQAEHFTVVEGRVHTSSRASSGSTGKATASTCRWRRVTD